MAAVSNEFSWPVRVYYEDTDAGGVVYHSQYLNFMERARTEVLRSLGFVQTELKSELNVIFVVRSLQIEYQKPAKFDDALVVKTSLLDAGRSLLTFKQTIYRCMDSSEIKLTQATVEVVCVNAENFKPMRIPEVIRSSLR